MRMKEKHKHCNKDVAGNNMDKNFIIESKQCVSSQYL